jgi:hypothetical protein
MQLNVMGCRWVTSLPGLNFSDNNNITVVPCRLVSPLSSKQLQAVSGLAKGLSCIEIAKILNVSTRTVERWQKVPEFLVALAQIQTEVSRKVRLDVVENISSVNSRLENLASKSLDCLEEIIDNHEARSNDRIQAAKIVLTEWQRCQPPLMNELTAIEALRPAQFDHLEAIDWNCPEAVAVAHQELRILEWQISIAILRKTLEAIKTLDFTRVRDLVFAAGQASVLARKASELWSGDGNLDAAITFLGRYDYKVTDLRRNEED